MPDTSAGPMAGAHESVIKDVLSWLEQGRRVWLCTIVDTWGSSPRPAGSWLAVNDSGQWSGSVSGGCLEEDLLRRTVEEGADYPVLVDYGITDNDRDDFRLPCGGSIRLLVEPLGNASGTNSAAIEHVRQLAESLKDRGSAMRRVSLQGSIALELAVPGARPGVVFNGEELRHTLQPECRLLLIGAGEVARYVAEFAVAADFNVTLCEPREAFASGWGYDHLPLDRRLPDDLITGFFDDPCCGVLALAHDPRIDDMGLLAALESSAFYIGAMGSARTSEARRARLASLGVDENVLKRLRAPIGVDIPSKTPAEIAISVVADLIKERHHLRTAFEPYTSTLGK
ncbi:XdhC family protein [Marinobacter sp. 2_MG-2023]|uniref:XdhC family protein n=1 Tax=Marinobacter sp. 2_MG-2023 TaxID=3062679 RepID=UPI0026E1D238|nr:XdhC family protein [Marinobacter sp. 2_MG-2023]MDO6443982.1 XdhC family protein [Marinobacter sp. 2_MG-2023]